MKHALQCRHLLASAEVPALQPCMCLAVCLPRTHPAFIIKTPNEHFSHPLRGDSLTLQFWNNDPINQLVSGKILTVKSFL